MDQKIKDFLVSAKNKAVEFWKAFTTFVGNNKYIFFVIIPLFLLAKFRDLVSSYLTYKSDKDVKDDKKKNDVLEDQVKQANAKADALVKQAQETADNKPVVDENWDQKK